MTLRILIDMNLSPDWVPFLQQHGYEAVHWSTVGDPRATDQKLFAWARDKHYLIFTHDLDFGTALALTHAQGPSVVQVRGQDLLPDHLGPIVLAALRQHAPVLQSGALVVVDISRTRVRILPIQ